MVGLLGRSEIQSEDLRQLKFLIHDQIPFPLPKADNITSESEVFLGKEIHQPPRSSVFYCYNNPHVINIIVKS